MSCGFSIFHGHEKVSLVGLNVFMANSWAPVEAMNFQNAQFMAIKWCFMAFSLTIQGILRGLYVASVCTATRFSEKIVLLL